MSGPLVFLLLLVIAAVVIVVVVNSRKRREGEAPPAPVDPLRRDSRGIDPRRLKPGDIINHAGRDWVVRGTLEMEQDGFRWHEHLLDDAAVKRWLSVEDDEDLELVLWEGVVAPELSPGAPTVEYGGRTYRLDERGSATYRASGTTGTAPTGRVEYVDYADGEHRLSFERYGTESWEVGAGVVLNERSLDIYPSET